MEQERVKKILAEQLELLSEKSKNANDEQLAKLSEAMGMIANSYLINYGTL